MTDCKEQYTEAQKEIINLLAELQCKVLDHSIHFNGTWGYVGDLNYIATELRQLNKFITIEKPNNVNPLFNDILKPFMP